MYYARATAGGVVHVLRMPVPDPRAPAITRVLNGRAMCGKLNVVWKVLHEFDPPQMARCVTCIELSARLWLAERRDRIAAQLPVEA